MNNKQIAFIIEADNILYCNESIRYIKELEIPEGYEIDILCIQQASSREEGRNEGMQASNAKYKVYLSQGTFILNTKFIFDFLDIFWQDEMIGVLGVIGTDSQYTDKDVEWNVGYVEIYDGKYHTMGKQNIYQTTKYTEVISVNDCIMVTQYDDPWEEDRSIGQSAEMKKKGYKIVVPYQEKAWCYCDLGNDRLNQYGDDEECENIIQLNSIRNGLVQLLERGKYNELIEITEDLRTIWPNDLTIREITNIMEIYEMEEENNADKHSEIFAGYEWNGVYEWYKWVHFVLLRIEKNKSDERIEELKQKIIKEEISKDVIWKIATNCFDSTARVFECLLKEDRQEPLVSVIVSVYNGEDTIGDTIHSVLGQTYQNIEVIVVDDASTDNSRNVISAITDPRVKKIFLEKNRHVCYAGNIGYYEAKGKYVALIGHDDLWKQDKLEKQVEFMEEHPSYTVCFSWVDIIDEEGRVINEQCKGLYTTFCGCNHSRQYWIKKMLLGGNQFCAPSACIRREFLDKTGFYKYGLVQLQDYDLWLRLFREGMVYILQEKLVLYRRFVKSDRNISAINSETKNRAIHEGQWIQDSVIEKLSMEEFLRIFKNELENPKAYGEKEILCEKVLLLRRMRNCYFVRRFIELLEDDECRKLLEDKYHLSLVDFYKMNAETMLFDASLLEKMQEQERIIEYYQQMQDKS